MKILAALLLAMPFLTAGCSSSTFYWYHPDRSLDEAKADFVQCQEQARQTAGDVISGPHYDRLAPPDASSTWDTSSRSRGRAAPDADDAQGAWRDRYEQSVIADGMRAKGYMKVRSDRVPSGVHTTKLDQGAVAGR